MYHQYNIFRKKTVRVVNTLLVAMRGADGIHSLRGHPDDRRTDERDARVRRRREGDARPPDRQRCSCSLKPPRGSRCSRLRMRRNSMTSRYVRVRNAIGGFLFRRPAARVNLIVVFTNSIRFLCASGLRGRGHVGVRESFVTAVCRTGIPAIAGFGGTVERFVRGRRIDSIAGKKEKRARARGSSGREPRCADRSGLERDGWGSFGGWMYREMFFFLTDDEFASLGFSERA